MTQRFPREVPGRVSVVTPVHNGRRYLPAMLESVLRQSYGDIEMILADDGSDDGTAALAESFRPEFARRGYSLRVLRGEHRGAAAAINLGLPFVSGEFLTWPDSDDLLEPDSVARRAAFLREKPAYRCVRSLSRYIGEDGGPAPASERRGDPAQERLFLPVLRGETFVCCGCYLLRSRPFFAIYPERRIPEQEVGQNFQMLLPFLHRWPCPTLREELYTVRVHPDSHSRLPRTREEEEARYAGFEALIDQVAALCPLSPAEAREIRRWKLRRRYDLARRYRQYGRAAAAVWELCRREGIPLGEAAARLGGLLADAVPGRFRGPEE